MPTLSADPARPAYRVHGLNQSFFTRKVTGYLDYKGIPWLLRRSANAHPRFAAGGWPGGMPVVEEPDGGFMWDSTSVILHLDARFPVRGVLPDDPVQRFLCFLLDDVIDEWLYRVAVGSRWYYEENHRVGGWELGRETSVEVPAPGDAAYAMVGEHVRSSCPPLGVTAENVGTWIDEVLRPWLRVLGAHLTARPYLFGERPSLADVAAFGGDAAHFVNDPLCRRWTDADAPAVVRHTHRLLEPEDQTFGPWSAPDDVPDTLIGPRGGGPAVPPVGRAGDRRGRGARGVRGRADAAGPRDGVPRPGARHAPRALRRRPHARARRRPRTRRHRAVLRRPRRAGAAGARSRPAAASGREPALSAPRHLTPRRPITTGPADSPSGRAPTGARP